MSACIYHHWAEKIRHYFFFSSLWHFSGDLIFHIYLFSPFLASTKTGGTFLYLLQLLLPCWHWGSLANIYTSGLPERKTTRERSRGGGEDTCLCFAMRWSQDTSRLLSTGKHSQVLWLVYNSLSSWPCEEKDGQNSTEISVHGQQHAAMT